MVKTFNKNIIEETIDWGKHIVIAVLIAGFIIIFVGQRTVVSKTSMVPTLHDKDNLIIEKITPRFGLLERGDIVIIEDASEHFESDHKLIIKRIIALENETIEIKDGIVYINGIPLREDYIENEGDSNYGPVKIDEGHVFVLGDNRPNSHDSRKFGQISVDKIKAKAFLRIYPFKDFGLVR